MPKLAIALALRPLGMRDMQAKAFEAKDAQYILLKTSPTSGKSRALIFLAVDKLWVKKLLSLYLNVLLVALLPLPI